MGFLTGKNTQKTENKAYDYLKGAYSPAVSTGANAMSTVASLLGQGSPEAGAQALSQFQNSTGYQNVLDSGTRALVGNAASRGLLRSGSTGKAITNFGQEAAKSSFNSLLQNLLGLSGQGLQAGSLISGAGTVQKSKSKPGLAPYLGAGLSMIPGLGPAAAALAGGV